MLTDKEEHQIELTKRLIQLIKTANASSPEELAVHLVKQGVVDIVELKRQIKNEIIDWEIIWH